MIDKKQRDLEKDAARYRWLKKNIKENHDLPGNYYLDDNGKTWDKTIDASMEWVEEWSK